MIRPLLAGALLFALPTVASAQEEMKTRNMGAVYAGMGTVQLGGSAMWGPELGLSYRSEMGFFAFEAEPVSVLLDDFGERTGLRVGFLSPGVRFMFLENRQVSPSVGASIGFNYTVSSARSDLDDPDFASLAFEVRGSIGVDFARQSDLRPVMRVDVIFPTRDGLFFDEFDRRAPPVLLARLGIGFPTRISALDLVDRWMN